MSNSETTGDDQQQAQTSDQEPGLHALSDLRQAFLDDAEARHQAYKEGRIYDADMESALMRRPRDA